MRDPFVILRTEQGYLVPWAPSAGFLLACHPSSAACPPPPWGTPAAAAAWHPQHPAQRDAQLDKLHDAYSLPVKQATAFTFDSQFPFTSALNRRAHHKAGKVPVEFWRSHTPSAWLPSKQLWVAAQHAAHLPRHFGEPGWAGRARIRGAVHVLGLAAALAQRQGAQRKCRTGGRCLPIFQHCLLGTALIRPDAAFTRDSKKLKAPLL